MPGSKKTRESQKFVGIWLDKDQYEEYCRLGKSEAMRRFLRNAIVFRQAQEADRLVDKVSDER